MLSRESLRQELNDLQMEIASCKILIHPPNKHPQFEKLAKLNDPTAALEIPKKLFLLWSRLRRKQDELVIPASSFVELLQNSLVVEA